MFPCEFCEIFKNTNFKEHLQTTALESTAKVFCEVIYFFIAVFTVEAYCDFLLIISLCNRNNLFFLFVYLFSKSKIGKLCGEILKHVQKLCDYLMLLFQEHVLTLMT